MGRFKGPYSRVVSTDETEHPCSWATLKKHSPCNLVENKHCRAILLPTFCEHGHSIYTTHRRHFCLPATFLTPVNTACVQWLCKPAPEYTVTCYVVLGTRVSCAKTDEPNEMPFGTLTHVGSSSRGG